MRVSPAGGSRATVPPDPLERLLEAEALLADEYERAQDDAQRTLADARARAQAVLDESAAAIEHEREAIAARLDGERRAALAALDAETRAGLARFELTDARIDTLATQAIDALFAELEREAGS